MYKSIAALGFLSFINTVSAQTTVDLLLVGFDPEVAIVGSVVTSV